MTAREIVFVVVGAITALSALLSVLTTQVVHAALWLLVALGTLAGCYVVLGQEFVGLVQLLVYVGAIVVLVLFALMLTQAPIGRNVDIDTPRWQRVLGALVGAATTVLLAAVLVPVLATARYEPGPGHDAAVSTAGIADLVFSTWVWPFELLSVLLLVALIGAFAVSRLVMHRPGDPE